MGRQSRALVGAVLVALFATPAAAKVLWKGDFESGDISQWTKAQIVASNRIRIVSDPVRDGRFAARFLVRQGDDPIGASGNRSELVQLGQDEAGKELVYRWHTMWPSDYASEDTWQLFTQWHHTGSDGSPPVEFFVWGEQIYLRVNGDDLWSTPLVRGRWQEFVFRVKWARNGWVELHHNGRLVLPKTSASTLYAGQGVYLKQGLYRDAKVAKEQVIFHDAMTIATSLDDVQGGSESSGLLTAGGGGDGSDEMVEDASGRMVPVSEAGGCNTAAGAGLAALVMVAFVLTRRRTAVALAPLRRGR